jgi:hypothetical protein
MLNTLIKKIFNKQSTKQITNFDDIIEILKNGRQNFYKNSEIARNRLSEVFDLYFDVVELIKKVTSDKDQERLILEAIGIAFRRLLSSFIMLESGFNQEARMLLRNFLEYILIIIDITCNSDSLNEWEKTEHDNLDDKSDAWYFKPQKIIERIKSDTKRTYPPEEKINAENAYSEWKNISNQVLHAHSRAQTQKIFKKGFIELFGWYSEEGYRRGFGVYREFLIALTQETIFIPKYKEKIEKDGELLASAISIAQKFTKYQCAIACETEIEQEIKTSGNIKKDKLKTILNKNDIPANIESTPDNALIRSVEIIINNGEYNVIIEY